MSTELKWILHQCGCVFVPTCHHSRILAEIERLKLALTESELTRMGKMKWVKVHAFGAEIQCLVDPAWEGVFQNELSKLTAQNAELRARLDLLEGTS